MSSNSGLLSNNSTSSDVSSTQGETAGAFAASLITSIVVFAVESGAFLLIKDRFSRIYQPRTYLVPERQRTRPVDAGWWKWMKPVLSTSNSEIVSKCGLDAYFFLRYLRTLLKIFVPAACVILPILLPLNSVGGRGADYAVGVNSDASNVTGLDQLAWGNVRPTHTGRYWAHWLLALMLISWVCYVTFDELRGYIRMRQAYLTSPQHRLRASATTVLVSSIPRKWCTVEALDGLYDVFPGGLRNIWINRNFDELSDKINRRNKLAQALEGAETDLIKKCFKAHEKKLQKEAKQAGEKTSKQDKQQQIAIKNEKATQNARGRGVSSGNPHQVHHTVDGTIADMSDSSSEEDDPADAEAQIENQGKAKPLIPVPIVGEGLQAVVGGVSKLGKGVLGGLRKVDKELNNTMDTTNGYVPPSDGNEDNNPRDGSSAARYASQPTAADVRAVRGQPQVSNTGATPDVHIVRPSYDSGVVYAQRPQESDTRALSSESPTSEAGDPVTAKSGENQKPGKLALVKNLLGLGGEADEKEPVEYPEAFDNEYEGDHDDAVWKTYLEKKERDTMRLPIFGWQWMPSLPFVGEKVDTIYYCRKEVARLNAEIEEDQAHPERFPLMNSAFIQFNHQVAAHMACQSLSHHVPKQMAPRLVEISPQDVIWENMAIPWWQRYLRTVIVVSIVCVMIVLWAIPVAFTSALSQLHYLAEKYSWLHWLLGAPKVILSILQGVLPTVFLQLLTFLLPMILRFLVKKQGIQSGMLVELSVQKFYFCFLFVQLFIVVSISSAVYVLLSLFTDITKIEAVPNLLAENIPKASNYFFSYMLLQALSVSAGALLQVGSLIGWFILAPLLDGTARKKFRRQTNLPNVKWGTFFPVYTNLAVIGLIYSIISPLILVFNIITFSLFWFVYRYNNLYVTKFDRDTGGLLYPSAINSTFTGVYVMEIVLTALFFLVRDENDDVACKGQAIGMLVIFFLTAIFQALLNQAFAPLFRYLPITLEDDAVRRDEEFARALNRKQQGILENEDENEDLQDVLEAREKRERDDDKAAEEIELQRIAAEKEQRQQESEWKNQLQNPEITMNVDGPGRFQKLTTKAAHKTFEIAQNTADITANKLAVPIGQTRRSSWADRDKNRRSVNFGNYASSNASLSSHQLQQEDQPRQIKGHRRTKSGKRALEAVNNLNNFNPLVGDASKIEAQQKARNELSDALFGGYNDELEDMTAEQRDGLVQRAFQHSALRARRPVIWLPRDELGVSDDEIKRMSNLSQNYLWVSNVRQGLDAKGRCVYSGTPPDFSEIDLIEL